LKEGEGENEGEGGRERKRWTLIERDRERWRVGEGGVLLLGRLRFVSSGGGENGCGEGDGS
jgi:hypothetical protein